MASSTSRFGELATFTFSASRVRVNFDFRVWRFEFKVEGCQGLGFRDFKKRGFGFDWGHYPEALDSTESCTKSMMNSRGCGKYLGEVNIINNFEVYSRYPILEE